MEIASSKENHGDDGAATTDGRMDDAMAKVAAPTGYVATVKWTGQTDGRTDLDVEQQRKRINSSIQRGGE